MDVKDLNKSQLILLALLLSFVTSIATGIVTVTVTLMQQAPKSFTTPINRVVQQTVEKIQQVEGKTVTQTVVIKEEDLVVDAIAKNQSAIFSVSKGIVDDTGASSEISIGRGLAISIDGIVAVDGVNVMDNGIYYVKNDSGKFKATFVFADKSGFSFLKIGDPVDSKSKTNITLPTFGDLTTMKVGQKIIVLGSSISSFIFDGNNGPYKETDIPYPPKSVYSESKFESEKVVTASGIKWTIIRTVLVYGVVDNMSRSNIVLWAKDSLTNKKKINVVDDQFRTPTLAEDLAEGCVLAALKGATGIYHISGKDFMDILQMVKRIADFWHLDTSLITPSKTNQIGQPAQRPLRTGFILDKAMHDLGYNPHSFEEGLAIVDKQLKEKK